MRNVLAGIGQQFIQIFVAGGNFYTALWLMLAVLLAIAWAFSASRHIRLYFISALICCFVSFFPLEPAYQTVLYAALNTVGTLYMKQSGGANGIEAAGEEAEKADVREGKE